METINGLYISASDFLLINCIADAEESLGLDEEEKVGKVR